MQDIFNARANIETNNQRIELAREYSKCRETAHTSKYNLDMILVSKLSDIRAYKANVGIDMAYLILLEDGFLPEDQRNEAKEYYKEWKTNEGKYKGLERLMSAVESKITFIQSLMRYERDNT